MLENFTTGMALAPAAFDVGSFLSNATSPLKGWGGLLIILMGVVGLIVFAVMTIKKLMASEQNQQQERKWGSLALLLVVSGAFVAGGWNMVSDLGSGGETTIRDLGNGSAVVLELGS